MSDAFLTPCLLLHTGRMGANIARAQTRARDLGVRLRPHLKTAKSVEIAHALTAGSGAAAVSTAAEAAAFAEAGINDLLYTAPFDPRKLAALAPQRARGVQLQVLVDDPATVRSLAAVAPSAGPPLGVRVELDLDGVRGGISPDDLGFRDIVQTAIAAEGLYFAGLYAYGGATYNLPTQAARAAKVEALRAGLVATAEALKADGIPVPALGIGSSPALTDGTRLEGLTEMCAGVFVFQDLAQAGIGAAREEDIAIGVLASVVQVKGSDGRVFVDAGGLALSLDRSTGADDQRVDQGYGLVCDPDTWAPLAAGDVIVAGVSQEHGRLARRDGKPLPPGCLRPGDQVLILPNHACMTAAAHGGYQTVKGPGAGRFLPRVNGWFADPAHNHPAPLT